MFRLMQRAFPRIRIICLLFKIKIYYQYNNLILKCIKLEGKVNFVETESKVYCENCRTKADFYTKSEDVEKDVIDGKLNYSRTICFCKECNGEVYVAAIENENISKYKLAVLEQKRESNKENGFLNIIDEILMKYSIGKKALSLVLGWGEDTISNYYTGVAVPDASKSILDSVLLDEKLFEDYLNKHKGLLTEIAYNRSLKACRQYVN